MEVKINCTLFFCWYIIIINLSTVSMLNCMDGSHRKVILVQWIMSALCLWFLVYMMNTIYPWFVLFFACWLKIRLWLEQGSKRGRFMQIVFLEYKVNNSGAWSVNVSSRFSSHRLLRAQNVTCCPLELMLLSASGSGTSTTSTSGECWFK